MKRKNVLILGKILICIYFLIGILNYSSVFAEVNSQYDYGLVNNTNDGDSNSLLSVIGDIVLPAVLPTFTILESIISEIMKTTTDVKFFPWADMIVYNAVPILDINFINPTNGSLFKDIHGKETVIGKVVRSTYFSVLSICLGFLGLAVAINVIKLMVSTIAGEKAKYKEMINKTVITILLLFGLHYLISFVFYVNEQMVEVASNLTVKMIGEDVAKKAKTNIDDANNKDNEQIVENFFKDADHTSWWSPVTIAKKVAKEFFNWLLGLFSKDDDEITIEGSDRDEKKHNKPFPSKKEFIGYIKDDYPEGIDVAAFLLKDYTYRRDVVWSVKGNDSNQFNQNWWGPLRALGNTTLWVTGIMDTGLLGLQNLYNDVRYICASMYNAKIIQSNKDYEDLVEYYMKIINDPTKSDDDKKNANRALLFVNAYYKYVYDGEDKDLNNIQTMVANLGKYFRDNIYYTNVKAGEWSPKSFNVIPCILYMIFILQSIMFLFSYVKRLLYVIILALIGPATIIYDYITGSL